MVPPVGPPQHAAGRDPPCHFAIVVDGQAAGMVGLEPQRDVYCRSGANTRVLQQERSWRLLGSTVSRFPVGSCLAVLVPSPPTAPRPNQPGHPFRHRSQPPWAARSVLAFYYEAPSRAPAASARLRPTAVVCVCPARAPQRSWVSGLDGNTGGAASPARLWRLSYATASPPTRTCTASMHTALPGTKVRRLE